MKYYQKNKELKDLKINHIAMEEGGIVQKKGQIIPVITTSNDDDKLIFTQLVLKVTKYDKDENDVPDIDLELCNDKICSIAIPLDVIRIRQIKEILDYVEDNLKSEKMEKRFTENLNQENKSENEE